MPAAVIAALSLAGFADGRWWIFDLAGSVRPQLVLLGVAALALAIVLRSGVGAALAVIAISLNLLVVVPMYTDEPAAASGSARLRIGHLNAQGGPVALDELSGVLRERRPDVFVVLEPSSSWIAQLPSRLGRYRVGPRPGTMTARVVLFAAREVSHVEEPSAPVFDGGALAFHVGLGHATVRVLALHTVSPTSSSRRDLRDDMLVAAGAWVRAHAAPEVVLGDFNAPPWSSALDSLRDAGDLRSSSRGYGVQASWPARLGPFGVPIDDLLHSRTLTAIERETGPSFGSGHRSLWVTLAPAAGE